MTIRHFENEHEAKLYIELKKLFNKDIISDVRKVMANYPKLSQWSKDVVYEMAFTDYMENKWGNLF